MAVVSPQSGGGRPGADRSARAGRPAGWNTWSGPACASATRWTTRCGPDRQSEALTDKTRALLDKEQALVDNGALNDIDAAHKEAVKLRDAAVDQTYLALLSEVKAMRLAHPPGCAFRPCKNCKPLPSWTRRAVTSSSCAARP